MILPDPISECLLITVNLDEFVVDREYETKRSNVNKTQYAI